MKTVVLGLLAETFLHPGAGSALGVVDLPVAREAATSYPFVPGSGVKGALRSWWEEASPGPSAGEAHGAEGGSDAQRLFGHPDSAGSLSVSDGRLALLPVRSLDGPYMWVTCPHLLERLGRDLRRSGAEASTPPAFEVEPGRAKVRAESPLDSRLPLVLEERSFTRVATDFADAVRLLEPLVPEVARRRLKQQLVVLADEDFAWFARFGLAVQARNVLDDQTKTSTNLWYEEALPPDTVLYALVASRDEGDLDAFVAELKARPYLQIGGNETVGQGWVHVVTVEAEGGTR
jgi:CRISPR-associated protein Cmr4